MFPRLIGFSRFQLFFPHTLLLVSETDEGPNYSPHSYGIVRTTGGLPLLPPPVDAESGVYYLVDLSRKRERNPSETNELNNGDSSILTMLMQQDSDYADESSRDKRDVSEEPTDSLKINPETDSETDSETKPVGK